MTDKDVGGKSQQVMAKVKDLEKPSHIKINVGGATDDIDKTISQLAMAMIAAIIIVYLILVITFRVVWHHLQSCSHYHFGYRCSTCTHHYRRNYFSSSLIGMLMLVVSLLRML